MVCWPDSRAPRILITGSSGMLGRSFVAALLESGHPPERVRALSRSELDVTNKHAVLSHADWSPEIIIHCAANVNADACEREPEACRAVQVGGAAAIAELAERTRAKLLYPQSFLIFDGTSEPITEETPPAPLSVYGRCKLEAEELIRARIENALVIRMGGFFGGEEVDKNFVGRFVPHVCELVRRGERRMDVGDRVWQPTYTLDLARNCLHLLGEESEGIFNMSSHGSASFADLARACVEELKLDDRLAVTTVDATVVSAREAARRPLRAVLANVRLQREGLDHQRPWREALREYLARPYFTRLAATVRYAP